MLGNIIVLLAIAIGWYFAFSRMSKTEVRTGVLIFLAVAFVIVLAATLGFCSGVPGSSGKTIP